MDDTILNVMNCTVDNDSFKINQSSISGDLLDQNLFKTSGTISPSCWNWWYSDYYPQVIKESYPVYIKEKSYDVGKKAYEIIKVLRDKELIELNKVKDFVKLMDELIKLL